MSENSNLRWISSGEAPDLVAVLLPGVANIGADRLLGVLQRVRGVSPGSGWYVWRGWFEERIGGPFSHVRAAETAMARHLGESARRREEP